MDILLAIVLMACGILDVVLGIYAISREGRKVWAARSFLCISLAGFLWCFGYALMGMSHQVTSAYIMRGVALLGVTWCCPNIIVLLQGLAGVKFKHQRAFVVYMVAGAIVSYVLVATPRAVHFVETDYGMHYVSNQWIGRYVQYVYLASMFFLWFYMTIRWYRGATLTREKRMSAYVIVSGVVILVGVLFDTILPIFGVVSFPSSGIATFFAIALLYYAVSWYTAAQISNRKISEHIFTNIAVPVLILSDKMTIMDCNLYLCTYLGAEMSEVLGSDVFKWITDLPEEDSQRLASLLINQEKDFVQTVTIRRTESTGEVHGSVLYDKYGDILSVICLVRDTTKEREDAEAMNRMTHEVKLAGAAEKAFLKNVDQDLAERLKQVLALEEKLAGKLHDAEDIADAEELHRLAARSLDQVNDLIDLSKIEAGDFEIGRVKFSFQDLLREVLTNTAEAIDENRVRLVSIVSPTLPMNLIGDRRCLHKILTVLLNNAVRYTSDGHILLQVGYRIRFGMVTLQIKISDTGNGFREDGLNMIFGSPDREDDGSVFVGSDRELALCRSIVKLMKGEISVQSTPGFGTTFNVSLSQKSDTDRPIVPFREYRDHVLLLEHDQMSADSVVSLLREMGVNVTTVVRNIIHAEDLPKDESVSVIIGGSGLMNQLSPLLSELYPGCRRIYMFNYDNYRKLNNKEGAVCAPFLYEELEKQLR